MRNLVARASIFAAASLALLPVLAGCGGGGSPVVTLPPSRDIVDTGVNSSQSGWSVTRKADVQPRKKWTVLIYMNGANDLETYGVLNMNQLEKIGSTEDVNFVVQFKRIDMPGARYDTSNGDWSDTRRFYITRDTNESTISSTLISQRNDVDMGRKESMKEFIEWGQRTFPADRYCLVGWNHGAGWRKRSTRSIKLPPTRGFSYDDATNNHIDTVEMADAIEMGGGRKWDAFLMDMSLMQMLEVVYQIRDNALYTLGSEESPPGEGLPYDTIMQELVANPAMDGRELCVIAADRALQKYGAGSNSTQSVIDMSRVAAIVPALNTLGGALTAAQPTWATQIADARDSSEAYDYAENKDLIDFLDNLDGRNLNARVNDPGVVNAASALRATLSAAILYNVRGQQHPRSQGLAVFLPTPFRYRTIDIDQADGFGNRFSTLALAIDAPQWHNFLQNGPR